MQISFLKIKINNQAISRARNYHRSTFVLVGMLPHILIQHTTRAKHIK